MVNNMENAKKIALCQKLNSWIKDEGEAFYEYMEYGFIDVANDELKHSRKFKEMKEALGCY